MTREEVERLCERLAREHPDRATHAWLARQESGGWSVVRIERPPGSRAEPLKATVEARPKPPQPDDPRPLDWKNVPPY